MDKNNNRPRYLNLLKIKMPVTALLSIAHRASGLLLVVIIPFAIYVFQLSLSSEQGFNSVIQSFQQTWVSVILIILAWSFTHHFLSGLRFLLIDIDVGVERQTARLTAWIINIVSITIAIVVAGTLL